MSKKTNPGERPLGSLVESLTTNLESSVQNPTTYEGSKTLIAVRTIAQDSSKDASKDLAEIQHKVVAKLEADKQMEDSEPKAAQQQSAAPSNSSQIEKNTPISPGASNKSKTQQDTLNPTPGTLQQSEKYIEAETKPLVKDRASPMIESVAVDSKVGEKSDQTYQTEKVAISHSKIAKFKPSNSSTDSLSGSIVKKLPTTAGHVADNSCIILDQKRSFAAETKSMQSQLLSTPKPNVTTNTKARIQSASTPYQTPQSATTPLTGSTTSTFVRARNVSTTPVLGYTPPTVSSASISAAASATNSHPYQVFYHPYLLHNEQSLTEARTRLHTALEQTRQLRAIFTQRLWEKYHVLLEPVECPTITPIVRRCMSEKGKLAVQQRQNVWTWEKRIEAIMSPPIIPMAVGTSSALPSGAGGGSGGFSLVVLPEDDSYANLAASATQNFGQKKISGASSAAAQMLMERARANHLARRHVYRELATNPEFQQEQAQQIFGRTGPIAVQVSQDDLRQAKEGWLADESHVLRAGQAVLAESPRGGSTQLQPNTHVGAMGSEVLTGVNANIVLIPSSIGPLLKKPRLVPELTSAGTQSVSATVPSPALSSVSSSKMIPALATMPPIPGNPMGGSLSASIKMPSKLGSLSVASASRNISQSTGSTFLPAAPRTAMSTPKTNSSVPTSLSKSTAVTAAGAMQFPPSPSSSSSRSTLPQRSAYGTDLTLDDAMILYHRSSGQYRSRMRHRGIPPLITAWSQNFNIDTAILGDGLLASKARGLITARMGLRDAFCKKRIVNKMKKSFMLKSQRQGVNVAASTTASTLESLPLPFPPQDSSTTELPPLWQWMESAHCLVIKKPNPRKINPALDAIACIMDVFYERCNFRSTTACPDIAQKEHSQTISKDVTQKGLNESLFKIKESCEKIDALKHDASKAELVKTNVSAVNSVNERVSYTRQDARLTDERLLYVRQDATLKDDTSSVASLDTTRKRTSLCLQRQDATIKDERLLYERQDATLDEHSSDYENYSTSKKAKAADPLENVIDDVVEKSSTVNTHQDPFPNATSEIAQLSPRGVSDVRLACLLNSPKKAVFTAAGADKFDNKVVFSVLVALGLIKRSKEDGKVTKDSTRDKTLDARITLKSRRRPKPKYAVGQAVEALWQSPHEAHFSANTSTATTPYGSDIEDKQHVGTLPAGNLEITDSSLIATPQQYHSRSSKNKPFGGIPGRGSWYPAVVTKVTFKPPLVEELGFEGSEYRYDVAYDDGDVDEGLKVFQIRPKEDSMQVEEKTISTSTDIKKRTETGFDPSRLSSILVRDLRLEKHRQITSANEQSKLSQHQTLSEENSTDKIAEGKAHVINVELSFKTISSSMQDEKEKQSASSIVSGSLEIEKEQNKVEAEDYSKTPVIEILAETESQIKSDSQLQLDAHILNQKETSDRLHTTNGDAVALKSDSDQAFVESNVLKEVTPKHVEKTSMKEVTPKYDDKSSMKEVIPKAVEKILGISTEPDDKVMSKEKIQKLKQVSAVQDIQKSNQDTKDIIADTYATHNSKETTNMISEKEVTKPVITFPMPKKRSNDSKKATKLDKRTRLSSPSRSTEKKSLTRNSPGKNKNTAIPSNEVIPIAMNNEVAPIGTELELSQYVSGIDYDSFAHSTQLKALLLERQSLQLASMSAMGLTTAVADPLLGLGNAWPPSASRAGFYDQMSNLLRPHSQAGTSRSTHSFPLSNRQLPHLHASQAAAVSLLEAEQRRATLLATSQFYANPDASLMSNYARFGSFPPHAAGASDYSAVIRLSQLEQQKRRAIFISNQSFYGAQHASLLQNAQYGYDSAAAIRAATLSGNNNQASRVAALFGLGTGGQDSAAANIQLLQLQAQQQAQAEAEVQAQMHAHAQAHALLFASAAKTGKHNQIDASSSPQSSTLPQTFAPKTKSPRVIGVPKLRIAASAATTIALTSMGRPASAGPVVNSPISVPKEDFGSPMKGQISSISQGEMDDPNKADAQELSEIGPSTSIRRSLSAPPAQETTRGGRLEYLFAFPQQNQTSSPKHDPFENVVLAAASTKSLIQDNGNEVTEEIMHTSKQKCNTTKESKDDPANPENHEEIMDPVNIITYTNSDTKPMEQNELESCKSVQGVQCADNLPQDLNLITCNIPEPSQESLLSGPLRELASKIKQGDFSLDFADTFIRITSPDIKANLVMKTFDIELVANDSLIYLLDVGKAIPIDQKFIAEEAKAVARSFESSGVSLNWILEEQVSEVRSLINSSFLLPT